ncbi:MAG: S8 family serine peptidase, partial [Dehalococcoidia bacterium]
MLASFARPALALLAAAVVIASLVARELWNDAAPELAPRAFAGESADAVPGELIAGFVPGTSGAARLAAIEGAGGALLRDLLLADYALVGVTPGFEETVAAELLEQAAVVSAEPNLIRRSQFEPFDELYGFQWHLPQIGLPEAWDKTTGAGVTVAVVDGGVAYEDCEPEVCGQQFAQGPDFNPALFASPWDFAGNDAHANDIDGHGTHVASIIAEATHNAIGGAGIAELATIMPVRVLAPDGAGSVADVIDGIVWAADHNAQVINLTFGGVTASAAERDAVDY